MMDIKKISKVDEYEKLISNQYFKIDDIVENGLFTDIFMSNNIVSVRWSKSSIGSEEKGFILEPYFEYVKRKTLNKNFFYSSTQNKYENVKEFYQYDSNDIFKGKEIKNASSVKDFSRFQKIVLIADNSSGKTLQIPIVDFDYTKYFNTHEYDKMKLAKDQERLNRKKVMIGKYGSKNGERVAAYEVWIGMTKEMLIDSKGEPTRTGISTKTKNTYLVQYIYESSAFGTEFIYIENGKVSAIQSL